MKIKINPLDAKFSKLVRLKNPICESCKIHASSQIHHFKGRRYKSVRYDFDNCLAVCFQCHRKFHEDPVWAVDFMKKRLGNRWNKFILKAEAICKRYKHDKKLLEIWINSELKKYDR